MIRLVIALALLPGVSQADSLRPAGQIIWENDNELFGGLSGIEMFPDGSFLAISDRGSFFTGQILRENGEIIGVLADDPTPIFDSKGDALTGRNTDAEGLAIGADGTIHISFESNHRIMRHITTSAAGEFIPKHPDFKGLQNNSGLEALAIDADGTLYAIPERSGGQEQPFPVYRFDGQGWVVAAHIPRSEDFLVVGADFGPDGRFYVLERGFTWMGGFFSRIRSFEISDEGLTNEETLLQSGVRDLGNMEGISVWQDEAGQTRLTIIADDNFNPLQDTVIAEYLLMTTP